MIGRVRGEHTYRFVVRGDSPDRLAAVVEPMVISTDGDRTVITGTIVDQSHLRGVLDSIADLGFQLVTLERLGPAPVQPPIP